MPTANIRKAARNMLGLAHRIFLKYLAQRGGEAAVRETLRRAGLPENAVFRLNEVYDDAEFRRIVGQGCAVLGVEPEQGLHQMAEVFFEDALGRFPKWFEVCRNGREFLELQPEIHNRFATGLADPKARMEINDKFHLRGEPDRIKVHYRSPNKLCRLYIALAHLVLNHYGDRASVTETRCMHKGEDSCEIVVQWFDGAGRKGAPNA